MKRLLIVAAIATIAAPAFAGPELLPVKGMNYATYDLATGELHQATGQQRYGDSVWTATTRSGYYTSISNDFWTVLDWGDIAGPQDIGGFAFSYATGEILPSRIECTLLFFAEENGVNSMGRVALAGFIVTDLPTGDPGGTFNGWTVTIDLEGTGSEFTIDGSDIDFDGLVDFGYTYAFPTDILPTGPTIAGDPNVEGPGMEDIFDSFVWIPDPNAGYMGDYDGTWWFGGTIFAQFYMELFDANLIADPECDTAGASGKFCVADIDQGVYPGDCLVNLADLAQLLSNYGTTSGADRFDGDLEPADGDGDVDLGDLAELLSQYGDDCNE